MTPEQRLLRNIQAAVGPAPITVYQGIVVSVEGITCTVRFGSMEVKGIKLRASEASDNAQLLIVPRENTAVIVGSLSGDLSNLVVLSVDAVERIEINGGKLGGLINIEALTNKINALVDAFNSHTHTVPAGGIVCGSPASPLPSISPTIVPAVTVKAQNFTKADYEDEKVKH